MRVPRGSHWTRGNLPDLPAEPLDATRALLLLVRGDRVYALSWQPAPFLVDIEGEGLGDESRERLLAFLATIRFE